MRSWRFLYLQAESWRREKGSEISGVGTVMFPVEAHAWRFDSRSVEAKRGFGADFSARSVLPLSPVIL